MIQNARNYDELNAMVTNPRSEPYDEYFDSFDITKKQKEDRVSLAESLEDKFLPILIFLFTMRQYGIEIDWEAIVARFDSGYREAAGNFLTVDDYMDSRIRTFSYDVTDSTRNHLDDPYYYSIDRAMFMSEEESAGGFAHEDFIQAILAGKTKKKWMDIRDKRERETHRRVGGTVKPIMEPFVVGDSLMMYPKDSETFGAEAREICGCRCTAFYF